MQYLYFKLNYQKSRLKTKMHVPIKYKLYAFLICEHSRRFLTWQCSYTAGNGMNRPYGAPPCGLSTPNNMQVLLFKL